MNLSAPTHQSGLQFGRPDILTPLAPLGARQYWSEKNFGHLDHCVPEYAYIECQSIDLNFRNQVASKPNIHFLQNNYPQSLFETRQPN